MVQRHSKGAERGFSLLELMIVLAVLTVIMGVVFTDVDRVQRRYKTEENKLDIMQQSREGLDQITRDLHQSGFPKAQLFALNVLGGTPDIDARNAVGIVSISQTDLRFEGDVNADGSVDSVRYTLQPDPATGNCPCTLARSQMPKLNGIAPLSQTTTYSTLVENVINSQNTYTITGSSSFHGTTVSNNSFYGGYKSAPVFSAFRADGSQVTLPLDISTTAGRNSIRTIKTIKINLNVLAPYPDIQTGLRPAVALTATARLGN